MMDNDYAKHIDYVIYKIEKAIENDAKIGCKGIDIALDSDDYCIHNDNLLNDIIIRLTNKYRVVKYSYDDRADRLGYCAKHISIEW